MCKRTWKMCCNMARTLSAITRLGNNTVISGNLAGIIACIAALCFIVVVVFMLYLSHGTASWCIGAWFVVLFFLRCFTRAQPGSGTGSFHRTFQQVIRCCSRRRSRNAKNNLFSSVLAGFTCWLLPGSIIGVQIGR